MNRFTSVFVFSIVVWSSLAFSGNLVYAQGWGNDEAVTVYNRRDGAGESQSFAIGEYGNNRRQLGAIGNDRASSVYVSEGYRVRLCDSEANGGSGRCEEFGEGYHNLRYSNSVSHIRVTGRGSSGGGWGGGSGGGLGGRGVTVYDDRNYRGKSQSYGPGRYLNRDGQLGSIKNDEASSVIVERGFRVRFCENEGTGNGGGRCEEYNEGQSNLGLGDAASYIEVRRAGGFGGGWSGGGDGGGSADGLVIVYSERNQRGDQQSFGVGTYRNDQRGLGEIDNDDASSITVPNRYRVRICDNDGSSRGSGSCEEYGPGSHNLRYNDKMSYIRVTRSIF